MEKFIALLRGVNVGGKTVKMDRLRLCLESLSLMDVRTYIQSGNALFGASGPEADLRTRIEEALRGEFGFDVAVLLLSSGELAALLAANPFAGRQLADGERVHVTVLESIPSVSAVEALKTDPTSADEFRLAGRAAFILCRGGYAHTAYNNAWFEKKLKMKATTRNLDTMGTLAKMSGAQTET